MKEIPRNINTACYNPSRFCRSENCPLALLLSSSGRKRKGGGWGKGGRAITSTVVLDLDTTQRKKIIGPREREREKDHWKREKMRTFSLPPPFFLGRRKDELFLPPSPPTPPPFPFTSQGFGAPPPVKNEFQCQYVSPPSSPFLPFPLPPAPPHPILSY